MKNQLKLINLNLKILFKNSKHRNFEQIFFLYDAEASHLDIHDFHWTELLIYTPLFYQLTFSMNFY